jgi:hypothetical protein
LTSKGGNATLYQYDLRAIESLLEPINNDIREIKTGQAEIIVRLDSHDARFEKIDKEIMELKIEMRKIYETLLRFEHAMMSKIETVV